MPNGAEQLAELISVPIEELLVALGAGIGRSQAELDRQSIQIQKEIDEDPVLAQLGLQATWYQIPTTELELRVAVAMEGVVRTAAEPPRELVAGVDRPRLPRPLVQPVNARYQNQFAYDVQASSLLKLTVVPVPPPGRAAAGRPQLTDDDALAAARPHLFPKDDSTAPTEDRVTVNFNPGAAAWYVLQTRETATGAVELRALVKVDDATGAVLRHEERGGG
jgi:hypothetical protein